MLITDVKPGQKILVSLKELIRSHPYNKITKHTVATLLSNDQFGCSLIGWKDNEDVEDSVVQMKNIDKEYPDFGRRTFVYKDTVCEYVKANRNNSVGFLLAAIGLGAGLAALSSSPVNNKQLMREQGQ